MIWEDPFSFNPDRWLDENNKIKNNPAFIPFSVGRLYVLQDIMGMLPPLQCFKNKTNIVRFQDYAYNLLLF